MAGGIQVLLIEDDPGYSRLISTLLRPPRANGAPAFGVTAVSRLHDGLARLADAPVDVVLLDLMLPDSGGLRTVTCVRREAPDTALVVLTGAADERLALDALHEGAQDYLIKTDTDAGTLTRSIRYALERQRLLTQLENLSMLDHLTGLYNRRGFTMLAAQQVAQCRRRERGLVLLLADVDDLKRINDTHGHYAGDRAIALVADHLKRVSRGADITGRLGGDEFALLLADGDEASASRVRTRLQARLRRYNRRPSLPYAITVSVGVATGAADGEDPLAALLAAADARMYRHKRRRRVLGRRW